MTITVEANWFYFLIFISGVATYIIGINTIPYLAMIGAFLKGFFSKPQ